MHLAIICYRLKRDFGFTDYEIANFTGIPTKNFVHWWERVKKLINSKILQTLWHMDFNEELHAWEEIPSGHGGGQGFYVMKDIPEWYLDKNKKKYGEAVVQLGQDSENEYLKKLKNYNGKEEIGSI